MLSPYWTTPIYSTGMENLISCLLYRAEEGAAVPKMAISHQGLYLADKF